MCSEFRLRAFAIVFVVALTACTPAATPLPTSTEPPATSTAPPATAVAPTNTAAPANTPLPTSAPTAQAQDTERLAADIDAMLQKLQTKDLINGAILVARDGEIIVSKGYGLADYDQKVPITPQTRFSIGQLTEPFTALAILMLQEQGKLKVQDSICQYLTECPADWQPITIHHLLTQSSGLPYFANTTEYHAMMSKPVAHAQIMTLIENLPLDFKAGEKDEDWLTGSFLLGDIIERASGQPYQEFVRKNILDPLQMTRTTFGPTGQGEALGYEYADYGADPIDVSNIASAAGLYSTVEDLYRWGEAVGSAQLVSPESWEAMLTGYFTDTYWSDLGQGYGIAVGENLNRPAVGWHSQYYYLGGFKSWFARFPEDKVTVIYLGNREKDNPSTIAELVEKKVFGIK